MHNVKDSSENYLEAIYVLKKQTGHVRSVDVANHLDLSRPSVSKAMKKLVEDGHVEMLEDGEILLTPSGEKIGHDIDERHQMFKALLVKIGVSEAVAEEDACKMEHAISPESFDMLKKFLEE